MLSTYGHSELHALFSVYALGGIQWLYIFEFVIKNGCAHRCLVDSGDSCSGYRDSGINSICYAVLCLDSTSSEGITLTWCIRGPVVLTILYIGIYVL